MAYVEIKPLQYFKISTEVYIIVALCTRSVAEQIGVKHSYWPLIFSYPEPMILSSLQFNESKKYR